MTDQPPTGGRPTMGSPSRLDEIVVVGALLIIGLGLAGLFLAQVPQANLPIIAGLLGVLTGTVIGGYAGWRWGASASGKASQSQGSSQ